MPTDEVTLVKERVLGSHEERAPVLQWVGFLLAPVAFFAHLEIAYLLIPWACARQAPIWPHLLGAAAVLVAAAGIGAAWLTRVRTRSDRNTPQASGHPVEGPGAIPRTRFLGDTGLGLSGLLTLILLMQFIAGFFITVCQ
jgi:hypothetical protein